MKDLIETAIQIALVAHKGQVDLAGEPYILHPLWVMSSVNKVDEKIVAVLHDVVEDSHMTLDTLRKYEFPEHIIDAVDALSRRDKETYARYIERAKKNRLARVVKLVDILHHLQRSHSLSHSLKKRYLWAQKFLVGVKV